MATLGEAFIEVHADTKPFARELLPQLKKIVQAASADLKPESLKLGQGVATGVSQGVDKDAPKIQRSFRKVGTWLKGEGDSWADAIRRPFERLARGNFILTRLFGSIAIGAGGATRRILQFAASLGRAAIELGGFALSSAKFVFEGLKSLVGISSDVGRAMSGIASSGARVGAAFAALAAEMAALGPAAAALIIVVGALVFVFATLTATVLVAIAPFATLLNLLLALPAALTAIAVIIAPLVIAFHNLSDAMELVLEKDPKKLQDGLKKLSPTLGGLVMLLRGFSDEFRLLGNEVQKAFFTPIIQVLRPALDAWLPILTGNFSRIASALGVMVANVLKFATSRPVVEAMAMIMGEVASFLERNSTTLVTIFQALAAAATAALPVVLELLDRFGAFLIEFATWIMGAITDGRFEKWLRTGIASLNVIWNLIKSIIGLFVELFSQTDEGGRRFLEKITKAINEFRAWLKSPEGKKALENAVHLANLFAKAFEAGLQALKGALWTLNRIVDLIKWIRDNPIGGALSGIGGIIASSFSGGGVVPYDQVAMVHKGEPILDPANTVAENRQILADAGMLGVLTPESSTVVNVYIGSERLDEKIDYRVAQNNRVQARTLATGPRG